MKTLPGFHIQWPWSRLILTLDKSVETRSYPLPRRYVNQELAIIETPGPKGKQNGVSYAQIVGMIRFGEPFRYNSKQDWLRDFHRHKVSPTDPSYGYDPQIEKWGWPVLSVTTFETPLAPPKRRGIRFARECQIPISILSSKK